jgi:hypothetical protein
MSEDIFSSGDSPTDDLQAYAQTLHHLDAVPSKAFLELRDLRVAS